VRLDDAHSLKAVGIFRAKGGVMIGMPFTGFLSLLIISLIAAVVVHYAIGYRFLEGFDGFLTKWIAGWVGAWLGSPVLGHWLVVVKIGEVYILPALVAGFIGAFAFTAMWKARAAALKPDVFGVHETHKAA
jgi:uncharacterized membrane protein YeaQ/YmgE (transglycosylase-associated protein family)